MGASNIPITLTKTVDEDDVFTFDAANRLDTGETISSVGTIEQKNDTTGATPLTLLAPTNDSTTVQVRIQDGQDGVTYTLTCPITTSLGNTKELCGILFVKDC